MSYYLNSQKMRNVQPAKPIVLVRFKEGLGRVSQMLVGAMKDGNVVKVSTSYAQIIR
jgi:hypothetical protein